MRVVLKRRDVGYTIVSRFEESFREFLSETVSDQYADYLDGIPSGVVDKVRARSASDQFGEADDFFDETDFPDLKEIACYSGLYDSYFPNSVLSQAEFEMTMDKLYVLRNKIAHVERHFSSFELDNLLELTRTVASQLDQSGADFVSFTKELEANPDSLAIPMPVEFASTAHEQAGIPHNVPVPDYEYEGGFVGRRQDIGKLMGALYGPRSVITISGAGGVGKTALALRVIHQLLQKDDIPFDGIVWLSAKETRLSYLGIEAIEPTVKNYEELLDSIFEVMGFGDPSGTVESKESDVVVIFDLYPRLLIVIDNFETITDDRITEFILDLEDNYPEAKVLLTSRRGLGQVERRYELKQLQTKEAVVLFRRVAHDKRLDTLARIDNATLQQYVEKVACFPLAIKWVVGQVAIGKDINEVISVINENTSDISKFSFEQVYNSLSPSSRRILSALSLLDDSPPAGVLNFVVDLEKEVLEDSLQELILVSLVIPETYKNEQEEIATRFSLLSLTRGYVRQQLDAELDLKRELLQRLELVQSTIEEAERARKQYQFSLANLGATTEEERLAAMIAQNAFQKYQGGRYIEAVDEYKRASEIAPRFSSIYRNWAVMEADQHHSVEADALMQRAADLNPHDVQIWLTWGNIKRRQSKIKDALEKYQRAYELSPNDAVILNALGQAKTRSGAYSEADALFREALATEVSGSTLQNEIINRTSIARNLVRWAEVDRRSRNYGKAHEKLEKALKQCEAVVRLDDSDQKSVDLLRKVRIELGFLYKHLGRDRTAVDYFKQAIVKKASSTMRYKEARDTLEASVQAAKLLHELGEVEEARVVFSPNLKSIRIPLKRSDRLRSDFEEMMTKLWERETGVVKWFDSRKGYGFIVNEQQHDVFVHYSAIRGSGHRNLEEGQEVSFTTKEGEKGLVAKDVALLP